MNINIFNILIISGVIYGFIFSITIYFKKRFRVESSFYLASVVLFLSLSNFYYWIEDAEIISSPNYILYHIPWGLLVLPYYYLFVQTYFQKEAKNKYYFFIPYFLVLPIHGYILFLHWVLDNVDEGLLNFVKYFYIVEELLSTVFTIYVIWRTYVLVKREEKTILRDKFQIKIETEWLKKLLFFGLLICVFWFSSTIYSSFNPDSEYVIVFRYAVWISISILIYWLSYLGNYHGVLFKQRTILRERISRQESSLSKKKNPKIEFIKKIIEEEKLFLDPTLNANKASEKLQLSEKYFTRIFSEYSQESFANYIKHLRVDEAKRILLNEEYQNYTIIAIALESGFNSKSAFYRVFKEMTGMTPSGYKKQNSSHY
jgi:AraC-like DNA-binding protein